MIYKDNLIFCDQRMKLYCFAPYWWVKNESAFTKKPYVIENLDDKKQKSTCYWILDFSLGKYKRRWNKSFIENK